MTSYKSVAKDFGESFLLACKTEEEAGFSLLLNVTERAYSTVVTNGRTSLGMKLTLWIWKVGGNLGL